MQSLEHTTKTVGRGQRMPMNSLWPSTARTRARKCRMSVETARLTGKQEGTALLLVCRRFDRNVPGAKNASTCSALRELAEDFHS
jgi:hypothetical protein